MRDPAAHSELAEKFRAIAHPLRLRILDALSQSERNVGEIEHATGIGQPALSQQLGVLRKAGLVVTRKEAKLVFYKLAADELGALAAVLTDLAPDALPTSGLLPVAKTAPSPSPGVANFARLS